MSSEPARTIVLAEDFYQGLLTIQAYADAHGGRGRQLVNAIMDFAYQIIGSAPQACRYQKTQRWNFDGLFSVSVTFSSTSLWIPK